MSGDIRKFSIGGSDYSKHKYQSWDLWLMYSLNPFDADITKRMLRTKKGNPRELDLKKVRHICSERIRQIRKKENVYPLTNSKPDIPFCELIKDYKLTAEDKLILCYVLYPSDNRKDDYKSIIKVIDEVLSK